MGDDESTKGPALSFSVKDELKGWINAEAVRLGMTTLFYLANKESNPNIHYK
jgi:hypothetical protein